MLEGNTDSANLPPSPLSWLDDLLQDDSTTIYSYASTWSSNFTTSNLPGPGRILGNLLSTAGLALERRLGKLAYRAGLGTFAKSEASFRECRLAWWSMLLSENTTQQEKACSILLGYASSNNPTIQLMAFHYFIFCAVPFTSLWSIFERYCQKRNESIEAVAFSWRRSGVEYSSVWLFYYSLASRCLSAQLQSVMDAIAKFRRNIQSFPVHYTDIEDVLLCCSDVFDTTLAIENIGGYWNVGRELETYIKRKGFKDPGLHKLASALLAYLEVECSNIAPITIFSPSFPFSASAFILGMWASVRALEPRESDNVSEDNSQLLIWAEVFKMNCVLRSRQERPPAPDPTHFSMVSSKTWKEICYTELPGPDHVKLRERLLQLEDIHEDAIRKRFPSYDEAGIS